MNLCVCVCVRKKLLKIMHNLTLFLDLQSKVNRMFSMVPKEPQADHGKQILLPEKYFPKRRLSQ